MMWAHASAEHALASKPPPECKPHHSTMEASLALFLCLGLVISYLPQIIRIIVKKSSVGFSPWFLFLGATSSASSFLNVIALQWSVIACCRWLTTGSCAESLLGLLQVGLQWFLFVIVLILFLTFYPRELRYERAIALTGSSRDIAARDIAEGYESDSSTEDLDSLDSHIAENYSNFASTHPESGPETPSGEGLRAEESSSQWTQDPDSPSPSALASHLTAEEEGEGSSSAFSRLVPTFWPVWKAPFARRSSPLATSEQLPANATPAARAAAVTPIAVPTTLAASEDANQRAPMPTREPGRVSFQGLKLRRKLKRRTKEWNLALSLAWLVAFHFIFILLVTLLLVASLPPSSFPPPEGSLIVYGPSSRLLVSRWAAFLGYSATLLAAAQYIPQIVYTARAKLVGSLSIPMMCLQVPGSAVFVYSLALRPGVNITSLAAYICTGVLQAVLLGLCVAWRIRERNMGVDDYGRPLAI